MNVDLFAQFLRDALSGTMGTREDKWRRSSNCSLRNLVPIEEKWKKKT